MASTDYVFKLQAVVFLELVLADMGQFWHEIDSVKTGFIKRK